jgi:RNA polymerase sigma factor (sigma-70 family)
MLLSSMDFTESLRRAQRGDRGALDQLFARFYPSVQAMVHRSLASDLRLKRPWLGALFSTGDVVQEVFFGVLRDIDHFEGEGEAAFTSFLATMVKNRLLDAIRHHEAGRRDRRRMTDPADTTVDAPAGGANPPTIAAMREQVGCLKQLLAEFPVRDGMLLRLRLEGEESFRAIADQLGYPSEDAARKAFCVAQARLLLKLRAMGMRPGGA